MNQKGRQVKLVLFQAGKDQNNPVRKHEGHGQKRQGHPTAIFGKISVRKTI